MDGNDGMDIGQNSGLPSETQQTLKHNEYEMDGNPRGFAVIFYYSDPDLLIPGREVEPPEVKLLSDALVKLRLQILDCLNLKLFSAESLEEKMKKFAKKCEANSKVGCFFSAFINCSDGLLIRPGGEQQSATNIYTLAHSFKGESCKNFAGKPKIFLVQVCGRPQPGIKNMFASLNAIIMLCYIFPTTLNIILHYY